MIRSILNHFDPSFLTYQAAFAQLLGSTLEKHCVPEARDGTHRDGTHVAPRVANPHGRTVDDNISAQRLLQGPWPYPGQRLFMKRMNLGLEMAT